MLLKILMIKKQMKTKLFLWIVFLFMCVQIKSQELKVNGKKFHSEGLIPSLNLSNEQIISSIKESEFNRDIENVIYTNEKAGFLIVKFKTVIEKDIVGRDVECWIYPKLYVKGNSIKIVVENIEVAFYATANLNSSIIPRPIEETKMFDKDYVIKAISELNDKIYKTIQHSLNKSKERWSF